MHGKEHSRRWEPSASEGVAGSLFPSCISVRIGNFLISCDD